MGELENREQIRSWVKKLSWLVMMLVLIAFFVGVHRFFFAVPPQNPEDDAWWGVSDPSPERVMSLEARVKEADRHALKGNQLMADDRKVVAAFSYGYALLRLPHAPITSERKQAYQNQFRRCFTK